jgi:hypothetical protein
LAPLPKDHAYMWTGSHWRDVRLQAVSGDVWDLNDRVRGVVPDNAPKGYEWAYGEDGDWMLRPEGPFRTVTHNLSPVVAQAHGDNERVFLITRQPYERNTVGSADFLILDGESGIIEKLTVVITPTGQPMRQMDMIEDGHAYTVWCSGAQIGCLPALRRREPTAEETTRNRDGSTTRRKEYN